MLFKTVIGGSIVETNQPLEIGSRHLRSQTTVPRSDHLKERRVITIPERGVLPSPTSRNFTLQWSAVDGVYTGLNTENIYKNLRKNEEESLSCDLKTLYFDLIHDTLSEFYSSHRGNFLWSRPVKFLHSLNILKSFKHCDCRLYLAPEHNKKTILFKYSRKDCFNVITVYLVNIYHL